MHAKRLPETVVTPSGADLAALRRLAPFAALTRTRFDALCRDACARSCPTRTTVLAAGARVQALHVVLEGCLELFARAKEREASVGIVHDGGSLVLSSVVLDRPSLVGARTCAPSRLLTVPAAELRAALARDPLFARAVTEIVADAERVQLRANAELKLHSAVERLATRLLRYERAQGGRGSLVLPCDKRTLASLLAMTPENLSRAFATLAAVAGVRVDGPAITLGDPSALAAVARSGLPPERRPARRSGTLDA